MYKLSGGDFEHVRSKLYEENIRKGILEHLRNSPRKTQHWMWWAFPQYVSPEVFREVSQTTRDNSLSFNEARLFLMDDILREYYFNALQILHNKFHTSRNINGELRQFFGDIDYDKFRRSITLFEDAQKSFDRGFRTFDCSGLLFFFVHMTI